MTRLVALLSFFDEQPAFLHRLVTSLPLAHVDTLVALDGRYTHFPCAYDQSPCEQYATLTQACEQAGIPLRLHRPTGPYPTEMAKRTSLFAKGEQATTPTDWYLIIDGDEQILTAPSNLKAQLEDTMFDVATAHLEQETPHPELPRLFRAIRGLHVTCNHYTYRTPDGRYLWGNARTTLLEARYPTTLRIWHDERGRTPTRRAGQVGYYLRRDHAHIEHDWAMSSHA